MRNFEAKVLTICQCNAPAAFQRLISLVIPAKMLHINQWFLLYLTKWKFDSIFCQFCKDKTKTWKMHNLHTTNFPTFLGYNDGQGQVLLPIFLWKQLIIIEVISILNLLKN